MAYATEANLIGWAGGEKSLASSVKETSDSTLSSKMARALLSADAKINGLLARAGFSTPVDTSGSEELASLLQECACVFALKSLQRSKASPAIMQMAAECRKLLLGLQSGTFGLPGTAAPNRKAFGPVCTSEDCRPEITYSGMQRDELLMGC